MFLTPTQIEALTDAKRSKEQAAWLRANGYRFEISRAGRIKVLIAEVERRMLSIPKRKDEERPRLELVS